VLLCPQVFNADANFHNKMRNKRSDPSRWKRVLGEEGIFSQMPHFHTHKDPKGWLVDILNIVRKLLFVTYMLTYIQCTYNVVHVHCIYK